MKKDISSVKEKIGQQKTEWMLSRIFWILMGIFIAAGIAGFFGAGHVSKTTVTNDRFSAEYEKYLRHGMKSKILIRIREFGKDSSLSINKDYVDKVRIDKIIPEPVSMKFKQDRLVLLFSSSSNLEVTFYIEPLKRGPVKFIPEINGSPKNMDQYVYF